MANCKNNRIKEIWKDIPTWEGWYQVSNLGRVRSLTRTCRNSLGVATYKGKVLSIPVGGSGYRTVCFSSPTRRQYHNVHKLVAEVFIGPCPLGLEVCHNNGKYADCRVKNLRYDTRSNNALDRHKHGTMYVREPVFGEQHKSSKLKEKDVRFIRLHPDLTLEYLGKKFGVHLSTIHCIRARKSWKHI